jgi:hypothetical protein
MMLLDHGSVARRYCTYLPTPFGSQSGPLIGGACLLYFVRRSATKFIAFCRETRSAGSERVPVDKRGTSNIIDIELIWYLWHLLLPTCNDLSVRIERSPHRSRGSQGLRRIYNFARLASFYESKPLICHNIYNAFILFKVLILYVKWVPF